EPSVQGPGGITGQGVRLARPGKPVRDRGFRLPEGEGRLTHFPLCKLLFSGLQERAPEQARKSESDKATAPYDELIRVSPDLKTAYFNRGVIRLQAGLFDSAIADLTKYLELDPKSAEAFYSRGVAWMEKRAFDKVIADCNDALRLHPGYAL